jgi:hypothetical protein
MKFPLVGSCVLFSLYLAFKFLPKETINAILSGMIGKRRNSQLPHAVLCCALLCCALLCSALLCCEHEPLAEGQSGTHTPRVQQDSHPHPPCVWCDHACAACSLAQADFLLCCVPRPSCSSALILPVQRILCSLACWPSWPAWSLSSRRCFQPGGASGS